MIFIFFKIVLRQGLQYVRGIRGGFVGDSEGIQLVLGDSCPGDSFLVWVLCIWQGDSNPATFTLYNIKGGGGESKGNATCSSGGQRGGLKFYTPFGSSPGGSKILHRLWCHTFYLGAVRAWFSCPRQTLTTTLYCLSQTVKGW